MAMTLRPDSAVEAALARLAAEQGISKHEAVLRAILRDDAERGLDADAAASFERMRVKYRDAIERLGTV
jgi:hypothetical protein